MNNYVAHGNTIQIPAPTGGVVGGQALKIGNMVGCVVSDAAETVDVAVHLTGVYTFPKEAPLVINIGEDMYWDDTAKKVTKTTSSNTKFGKAFLAAASADTTVQVRLSN